MGTQNMDIALRIKADLDQAEARVESFNAAVADTGKAADATATALTRSGQRIDALLANTSQMVQILQSMDTRLAEFTQGAGQAAQATAQVEVATEAAAAGIRALAESEDEAAARIRAVIQASREEASAVAAAATEITAAAESTDRHASSADNVADIVQRQNARMRESSVAAASMATAERQAAGGAQEHAAELSRLLGQIDPTIAAFERLDQQERELLKYRNLKLLDDETFQRFQNQINASRQAMGGLGISAGQTQQALRQLPAQITDITVSLASGMPVWMVFMQQGGQIKDSFGGAVPALNAVMQLITPMRVAIAGLVGTIALLTYGAVQGYRESEQLAHSITLTGNAAGTTSSQVDLLATALGSVNGRTTEARDILNGLVSSGRVAGDALADVGRAAVNMAALSGDSAKTVVAEWTKIADDPVRAAVELDRQYHFLTTTIFQQIQTLQQAGDQYGALKLIAKSFADETGQRMDELHQRMGWLESFADRWSRGVDNLKGSLLDIGKPADDITRFQQALAKFNETYDAYKRSLTAGSSKDYQEQLFAQSQQAYAELQKAQVAAKNAQSQAAAQGLTKQVQSEGVEAAARIDQLATSLDRAKQRQDALNKAAADLYKIQLAGGKLPEGINFNGPAADMPQGAGWDKLKAEIEKRYADPKVATPKINTKEAVNAQQELIQMLNQLQGQLDPTAAAWAKYNETVARATKQAEEAKKAPGANVAGIDAERQAVIQLAAAIRAADIKRITDEERQGWERLRESLRTPIEVAVETATTRIAELNKYLKDGIITAGQYQQALGRTVQAGFTKPPQFSGLAPEVGGAFGEIGKTFDAQKQLELWYQQQLQILNQFRAQKLGTEAQWNAQEQALQKQHEDSLQQIVVARQTAELAAASSVFGNLADLAKARFGEESKSYRALFALSKAFSIAQAAVSLATNVSKASEAGFPANLPLIAAAFAQGAQIVGLLSGASFAPSGYATGGEIDGPGTATSDSVLIRASRGEFMQRAAAVDYYGLDFMHAVNSLQYPRFATGGLIDAPRLSVSPSPRAPAIAPPTGGAAAGRPIYFRAVNVVDPGLITDTMAGPDGEEVFMNFIDRNAVKIKQRIG